MFDLVALKRLVVSSLLTFTVSSAHADILPDRQKIDGWLNELGGSNHFDARKKIDWGVLPGPFYTPEMGMGIGVAVVGLYRPDSSDHISQTSSLGLSGFGSSTGAFGLNFINYNFLAGDQWRLFVSGTLNNIPTYYWGKGYSAGKNNGNKEKYHSQEFDIRPRFLYRVTDATYMGLGWHFSSVNASNPDSGAKRYFDRSVGGRSVISSGVSAYFSYDTRDFLPNAQHGQAFEIIYTYFSRSWEAITVSIPHSFSFRPIINYLRRPCWLLIIMPVSAQVMCRGISYRCSAMVSACADIMKVVIVTIISLRPNWS